MGLLIPYGAILKPWALCHPICFITQGPSLVRVACVCCRSLTCVSNTKRITYFIDNVITIIGIVSAGSLDDLLAQALAFFLAGFETTAGILAFSLYELSRRPHMQLKVQEEVDAALKRHGGFTYQMLQELPYIDRILDGMLAVKCRGDTVQ